MDQLPLDIVHDLNNIIEVEIKTDPSTLLLYSTDASLYKINPLGVVFPKRLDDLNTIMELAYQYDVPILVRGSGSSLAGQAVGKALIVDCSRYLDRIIEISPDERRMKVEPGVILNTLNHAASQYGLQFGPDPSSAERATIGGSVANNATGSHSIIYGMAADHVLATETILSDGSQVNFHEMSVKEANRQASEETNLGQIYSVVLQIRDRLPEIIGGNWPKTYRTVSGYNLNYLIPWTHTKPPGWKACFPEINYPPVRTGYINMAQLIAGSEGTLGIIKSIDLRLVPLPIFKILVVKSFKNIEEACYRVPKILEQGPSAVELIPQMLVRLARSIPGYAQSLPKEFDTFESYLVVEFAGNEINKLREKVNNLGENILVAESPREQNQIWSVRKAGLGILMSRPGDYKPITGIEDMSVPVEYLGDFVRDVKRILGAHNTSGEFYGHASAGCLHIRPILNIKSSEGIEAIRSIGQACVDLVKSYGGSISAEHGDGLARGEWLEFLFGREILNLFEELKSAADPKDLLNPHKIIDVLPMDQNLRYSDISHQNAWEPNMDFSFQGVRSKTDGLIAAVEQCNGAGVCRKLDGFMCPSFQVTRDEMHSTRGRANLLRELIYGKFPTKEIGIDAVYEALDLCLSCKGCKVECPSAVDMAKLKYEYLSYYYSLSNKRRKFRDYLFGYISIYARAFYPLSTYINRLLKFQVVKNLGEMFFGVSKHRHLPQLSNNPFSEKQFSIDTKAHAEKVILLLDAFNRYFYPEVSKSAFQVLCELGYDVYTLPIIGAGRTLLSKGFIDGARKHLRRLVNQINSVDPLGDYVIIGIEPSEIFTLRDELRDLLPNDDSREGISKRTFMLDEYLIRPDSTGEPRVRNMKNIDFSHNAMIKVFLHGHCYQKSQLPAEDGFPVGVEASARLLEEAGYTVQIIDDGCCGMAGAFGYEAEHYNLSMAVGESALFPAVRDAVKNFGDNAIIAAAGISCKAQIEDGTGVKAIHPIQLIMR